MKSISTLQELRRYTYSLEELKKISKALHHLDECSCNYGLTKRQETRLEKLERRAEEIAARYGMFAYHQGDPRGCSLYLITEEQKDNYSDGIAICG